MDVTTVPIPERLDAGAVDGLLGHIRDLRRSSPDVVILAGGSGRFCTGIDLPDGAAREVGAWLRDKWVRVAEGLRGLSMPTLAVIDGPAFGAGFALALLADARIAGRHAVFAATDDAGRTNAPALGGLLAHHLPPGLATSLLLSGRPVDVDIAVAWGLVCERAHDDLLQSVDRMASTLGGCDGAVRAALRLLRGGEPVPLAEAMIFDSYAVEHRIDSGAS